MRQAYFLERFHALQYLVFWRRSQLPANNDNFGLPGRNRMTAILSNSCARYFRREIGFRSAPRRPIFKGQYRVWSKAMNLSMEKFFTLPTLSARKGGFVGELIGWFIRIVIYDICITTIQEVLGVSRFAALFIFLGLLAGGAFVFYLLKRRMSPGVDDPI